MEAEGRMDISIEQVKKAVKGMKLRKSPGTCGIHPELIKYGSPKLLEMRKMRKR